MGGSNTGFNRMSDEDYNRLYGNRNIVHSSPLETPGQAMDGGGGYQTDPNDTRNAWDKFWGPNVKLPPGVKQTRFSDPTPDQRLFTSYKPAQLGFAPQGRTLLERFGGAQIDPMTGQLGRQGQLDALGMYRDAANGQGPSVAQGQLRMGQDAAAMAASRMAMGGHGPSSLGRYMAGQQLGQMDLQGAQQAGVLRAQEIADARAGMLGAAGALRQGDMDLASRNADLAQQTGLFNTGQANQMTQQDMDRLMQYLQANAGFEQQANMAKGAGLASWGALASGNDKWTQEQNAQFQQMINQYLLGQQASANQSNAQLRNQLIGQGAQTAGGLLGFAVTGKPPTPTPQ
mgnify:CR=1 FL=1